MSGSSGERPPVYTKTGDDGTTGLLFGGRVSKADPAIETCGAVDEAVAALGLARATSPGRSCVARSGASSPRASTGCPSAAR